MIDTKELRPAVEAAGLNAISMQEVLGLLDRLEESESDALEQARLNGMGASREAALMARLEEAEKDIALKERIIDALGSTLNAVANERDTLLARIEAMELQRPVRFVFKSDELDEQIKLATDPMWAEVLEVPEGMIPLYALPGAQGE